MTNRDRHEMIELIGNLIAKAESQAGTPEGDSFEERAFQLLAKHGIDYTDLKVGHTAADAVVCEDYRVNGAFLHQQIMLLARIASALHCAAAYWIHDPTTATVAVYGAPRHLERVRILYAPLRSRMLGHAIPRPGTSGPRHDREVSWMQGFTLGIRERLQTAETAAAAEADCRTGSDLQTRTLAADAKRAANAKKLSLPDLQRGTYNPELDRETLLEGRKAGQNTAVDS